jgi:hypothetical protein
MLELQIIPGTTYNGAPFPLSRHKWQRIVNHAPDLYGDNAWRHLGAWFPLGKPDWLQNVNHAPEG